MSEQDTRPHLHVEFFVDTKENKRKSAEEGRPIFENVEKVKIKFVGDPKSELVGFAHQKSIFDQDQGRYLTYAERFPKHYEAFKENREYFGEGTPISELTFISMAKRKELAALNIHTAEALSELDGANLSRLGMGGRELKDKATAYLSKASGSADVVKLAGENAALREQMAALQKQMADLSGSSKAEAAGPDASMSPFADWADEDIKLWIKENGGSVGPGNPSHETLVKRADEHNETLRKQNEAA